ncbi:hypothetical protein BDZ89DRAFT_1142391 [Hymenopellis radicata]|nr:hypothetical protein BDZ89DRAFT_1142391 [Hymenopellis radicata]
MKWPAEFCEGGHSKGGRSDRHSRQTIDHPRDQVASDPQYQCRPQLAFPQAQRMHADEGSKKAHIPTQHIDIEGTVHITFSPDGLLIHESISWDELEKDVSVLCLTLVRRVPVEMVLRSEKVTAKGMEVVGKAMARKRDTDRERVLENVKAI